MWDYGEGNRGSELAIVSIAMAAVSVCAVSLRSYTMATILKRFLFEDWLAVFTCALQVGFCVVVVVGVSFGLGAHVEHVPEANRHKALVFKWAGQVAYIVVSTMVKFVVGIFLLRLCVNNNWQRITILVLLVIVGLFNIFYVFMAIFQCQPVDFYWWRYTTDPPVTGKCNGHTLATIPTYFAVLIGIASDLTLALLPATLIKGAKLDHRTKISVCCVLALGSLASVATIARIPYAKQLLSNPDYLYNFTDLAIWSIVECGIAITASSLATLRPLFVKMALLANTHFTSRYASRGGGSVLPIQSAKTITIISGTRTRSTNRNTGMSGTTALTGSTGATAGLASVTEGREGILVEKNIEMSVMTKVESQDSIDKLEEEINELIRPGSTRHKPSYENLSSCSTKRSNSGRQRPPPLQTTFSFSNSMPSPMTNTASAGSSSSGSRHILQSPYSNTPSPRRPSDGFARRGSPQQPSRAIQQHVTPTTPNNGGGIGFSFGDTASRPLSPASLNHQRTYSGGVCRSPGGTMSPPSFHLPIRAQQQQVRMSDNSDSSFLETPGLPGLSAPPRVAHDDFEQYQAPCGLPPSPLGSPGRLAHGASRSLGGSPRAPSFRTSPIPSPRYHFQRQEPIPEAPGRKTKQRGAQRVSAFLADSSSESSLVDRDLEAGTGVSNPRWHDEMPSPLRSNPPLTPRGDWI